MKLILLVELVSMDWYIIVDFGSIMSTWAFVNHVKSGM